MPRGTLRIKAIEDPADLEALAVEATAGGHGMVARLLTEWRSGKNRFDRPGERSYVAVLDGKVQGVCGLNIDPFTSDGNIGRVRRLYVSQAVRRQGIASAIIAELVRDAASTFEELHLRTHNEVASAFYLAMGFSIVHAVETCTHRRLLNINSSSAFK